MNDDAYVMPSFPVLAVEDLDGCIEWYQKVLGFRRVFTYRSADGNPEMVHLRWCRYADVLLVRGHTRQGVPRGVGVTLYFNVDMERSGIDEFARRVATADRDVCICGPDETPWNSREVTIRDPNGYVLKFGQMSRQDVDMTSVLARMTDTSAVERPLQGRVEE